MSKVKLSAGVKVGLTQEQPAVTAGHSGSDTVTAMVAQRSV